MEDVSPKENKLKDTYLIFPQWGALWFLMGGGFLLAIGVSVRFLLGLSSASDQVFAIEALISGLATDFVFRRFMRRRLVVAPKVKIPFVYLWTLLSLYVFIARPFE